MTYTTYYYLNVSAYNILLCLPNYIFGQGRILGHLDLFRLCSYSSQRQQQLLPRRHPVKATSITKGAHQQEDKVYTVQSSLSTRAHIELSLQEALRKN